MKKQEIICMVYEDLRRVNEHLESMKIKGKDYVPVTERVKAYRELLPEGEISTEILHIDEEKVVMKATVKDEMGKVLATGLAMEKEGSTFINKTSHIEVCETSAVGRALGFLGIGIDASMASAEEVATAMLNQNADSKKYATDTERTIFQQMCESVDVEPTTILERVGWTKGKMTAEHYAKAIVILNKLANEK